MIQMMMPIIKMVKRMMMKMIMMMVKTMKMMMQRYMIMMMLMKLHTNINTMKKIIKMNKNNNK